MRSAHAAREGNVYSWNNPPPGGHPGQDYNCRCWAEAANCSDLRSKWHEISRKLTPVDYRLSILNAEIHNLEGQIRNLNAEIKSLGREIAGYKLAQFLGKTLGPIMTARLLAKNDEISKKKEDERRKVENKVYILKIQVEHAEQEYNACVGNKGKRGG